MTAGQADQAKEVFDSLERHLQELPARWLPRADDLRNFASRWVDAWNSHDLDELEAMVTNDVTWEDPSMRGQTVHGRVEFRAFAETFFGAFADVRVEGLGPPIWHSTAPASPCGRVWLARSPES